MAEQSAGPVVDGLGMKIDLDDGGLPAAAVLLTKIVTPTGDVALAIEASEGMSWIEQLGLVKAADIILSAEAAAVERE